MTAQTLQLYNTLVSILSLVSIGGAVSLVVYRMVKGPEAARLLDPGAIWLAWLVAAVATAGSLIYSEVVHFIPCRLCWLPELARLGRT